METAIEAAGLAKQFRVGFWARRVDALVDLSLAVQRGEVLGLLGPNGAGKTTAIKILMGFIRPSAGSGRVFGSPLGSVESRRAIGYLPENPSLYEFLTGDEYLMMAGGLAGLSRHESRRQSKRLLERVGLAGRSDRSIRKFSKGMVQRLGLAQALIGEPPVLILDEPMSGLDPVGRKDVRDLILSLRAEGRTVLFSTHILSDVETLCDRVGIIAGGRLTDCGTLTSLLDPGACRVEIVARELPELSGLRAEKRGGGEWVLQAASEVEANDICRALLGKGGKLVSVTPLRNSLEELFVRRAKETGAPL